MKTKIVVTFGTGQLQGFNVIPNDVALIVEGDDEFKAREKVFQSEIGDNFCTSYLYEDYIDDFIFKYNMTEYTLEELLSKTY